MLCSVSFDSVDWTVVFNFLNQVSDVKCDNIIVLSGLISKSYTIFEHFDKYTYLRSCR